jgi:hypothetical protein
MTFIESVALLFITAGLALAASPFFGGQKIGPVEIPLVAPRYRIVAVLAGISICLVSMWFPLYGSSTIQVPHFSCNMTWLDSPRFLSCVTTNKNSGLFPISVEVVAADDGDTLARSDFRPSPGPCWQLCTKLSAANYSAIDSYLKDAGFIKINGGNVPLTTGEDIFYGLWHGGSGASCNALKDLKCDRGAFIVEVE